MQPADLLRATIAVLRERGWCQVDGGHARGADGAPVPLFRPDKGGESRASINPAAASFTLYGAIVCALQQAGEPVPLIHEVWEVLYRLASAEMTGFGFGGVNHVHPLMAFNEAQGRTVEEAVALLEKAVSEIASKSTTVSA